MAIDKEYLKKKNAKKIYDKHHSKKSTDFDFSRASTAKSSASYDLNDTKDKKHAGASIRYIAGQTINGLSGEKSDNESVSESAVNTAYSTAYTASRSVYGVSKKAVNSASKTADSVSRRTFGTAPQTSDTVSHKASDTASQTADAVSKKANTVSRSAVSHKSNMLSGNTSSKSKGNFSNKKQKSKKARYKKNRRKVFKKARKNIYEEKLKKESARKTTSLCTKVIAGIISFAASNYLFVLPIMLIIFIFTGGSFSDDELQYTYPASEADITNTIELWQSLQVDLKNQHSKIPEMNGIKGKFVSQRSEICEFMNDNDKLLAFISAYKMPYNNCWHYKDISKPVTDIFNEMYGLDYSISGGHLTYRIVEKTSWDNILKKYLNDEKMHKYKDFYEHKGGLAKSLASPFGFDWSKFVTSPFGYRTWEDGSTEYHKGVDFGVPASTPILSVSDGVVKRVFKTCTHNYPKDSSCGCGGGYGNYVEILNSSGSLYIIYGHMGDVCVNVGDTVQGGQMIGRVGCTGWSTGNHLHLETRSQKADGELLDPLSVLLPYSQ